MSLQEDLIKIATSFLQMVSSELDPHTNHKGQISTTPTSASLFTPSHIQFAKYGRGPGKKPPIDDIIKWISEKGKIQYEGDVKDTAYAIAYSIGKNGTVGYTPNAPNVMDEAIGKHMVKYLGEVSKYVSVSLAGELGEIQYFPEEIDFKI